VLLNQATAGHALSIELDTLSAGAVVTVTRDSGALSDNAVVGGSYAGSSDPRLHFGLGEACRADVTVTWSGGHARSVDDVPAGQVTRIDR
jgi:hypothetical protein